MKLASLAAPLLVLVCFQVVATEHLTPLDANGTSLRLGDNEFMEQIFPAQADELAGFYAWPSSTPARYMGVLEANSPFRHELIYAENTPPNPRLVTTEISAEHANAISDRLAEIVRLDTRYEDKKLEREECLDGVEWIFASQRHYGKAYCYEPNSVPDKLTKVYGELAKISSGNGPSDLEAGLTRVIKMLDDILAKIKR